MNTVLVPKQTAVKKKINGVETKGCKVMMNEFIFL